MGWFTNWREKVDVGLRPRHVHAGAEINLYRFTKRAAEWLEQNLDYFFQLTHAGALSNMRPHRDP
jgi:hypothetical protein